MGVWTSTFMIGVSRYSLAPNSQSTYLIYHLFFLKIVKSHPFFCNSTHFFCTPSKNRTWDILFVKQSLLTTELRGSGGEGPIKPNRQIYSLIAK